MPEFSSSNIISNHFSVYNNEGESYIGHGMIIGHDLMVYIGLMHDLKHQVLQRDGASIRMKYPISLLGQTYLTSHKIREVVT